MVPKDLNLSVLAPVLSMMPLESEFEDLQHKKEL